MPDVGEDVDLVPPRKTLRHSYGKGSLHRLTPMTAFGNGRIRQ